ncbi:phosphate ABC transporter membrane protein 2 (PhoT family) [Planktotalea frisia]|uniref:Phosphate transport system permease protein PstA n=1 Tax=Planktotalea frisia TaxID=696762 RepID=A0A1L9NZC3_9RHOB|nr:phosphate ABC transporter permease PstA [Planktotalea frisia]OJI94606.1 phosphate transport system permease protein PstA [Planktotalea frisia]PZX35715.1 phosphate ABC transporter membrane protein 2 (PhoT family) [Planktotalea frisia]
MTDTIMIPAADGPKKSSLLVQDARTRKRNAAETRFRIYGMAAIGVGLLFLVFLFTSILRSGLPAFTQTVVEIEFTLTQEQFDTAETKMLKTGEYQNIFVSALTEQLDASGLKVDFDNKAIERIVGKPGGTIRSFFLENPDRIGTPASFELAASSRVDGYLNGRVTRDTLVDSRFLMATDLDLVDALEDAGIIKGAFNWNFVTGKDSGVDNPGGAGLGASVIGSFFMMLVVLFLSLPIGVAASIYLEEFAPKNRWTDLIEVNISNLAAVPSIVFGILGLAVFIQFAGFPQSAPLVGGLVLTLMTLPTIIISTRASLAAVPPSIRDAALGVGASKMQSVFHHVLPLAMPGILTGTIIGLAQALGETAPLLLIGMVGFVAREYPETFVGGFTDANSAMPAQIYTWASRADPGFYEKAWGGIIILLLFLITMNAIAVLLRRRFERRW